jgi:hypothetical protein
VYQDSYQRDVANIREQADALLAGYASFAASLDGFADGIRTTTRLAELFPESRAALARGAADIAGLRSSLAGLSAELARLQAAIDPADD